MCDKLVFDLSQEIEGSPNVFIRKDWINILDNQNQNYNNNQSVVDTSQLSNSNKYMSYRESYFSMPLLATLTQTSLSNGDMYNPNTSGFSPATDSESADYSIGLKNWFGQIIHSFTLDYNGTTICQQTPYINMWNSFKLLTSLSLDDVNTQGATIGFYPDDATSWTFQDATTGPTAQANINTNQLAGQGVCNNTDLQAFSVMAGAWNNFDSGKGNEGFRKRQNLINFDVDGVVGGGKNGTATTVSRYGSLLSGTGTAGSGASDATKAVWKSYISNKVNANRTASATSFSTQGTIQFCITATIYLKHIHSFFNMCPLLKGVFMKMTMNLNNTTTTFNTVGFGNGATVLDPAQMVVTQVSNSLGGVNPLMLASGQSTQGAFSLNPIDCVGTIVGSRFATYKMNISVGSAVLDSSLNVSTQGTCSKSVYLYIPAYTFNPTFEQAYLSSPVKQVKYTDVYQYQVINIPSLQTFNNLLTNGIANVKSVLILPFYSATPEGSVTDGITGAVLSTNTGFLKGVPVFQSPFDPAGTGPTSPMCWLTNFNIQVSGQNAIYNTQRYNFEQFNNQLYGQNAVNGGCTDGLTSGLIDRQKFDMEYSYYYVNVERMLPVEASVPKSIQILGTNLSAKALDLYCFIEYGSEISIDCLTGSRV
jgi:hypothetical protein